MDPQGHCSNEFRRHSCNFHSLGLKPWMLQNLSLQTTEVSCETWSQATTKAWSHPDLCPAERKFPAFKEGHENFSSLSSATSQHSLWAGFLCYINLVHWLFFFFFCRMFIYTFICHPLFLCLFASLIIHPLLIPWWLVLSWTYEL